MEKQKTILIVEDEKSLREAIVDILRLLFSILIK